jgi:hypothetical protein
MSSGDVTDVVSASSLGELCWVDTAGQPQARGVVVLVRGERPVLAFTYADEPLAREVARAAQVALAFTETRSVGRGFHPVLVTGRPRLVEDPNGDLYLEELVVQELRRYPPSRLLADSPLLMREHWWYLPRLVVEIDVDAVEPLPPRTATHDHVLVVAEATTPVVRPAGIRDRSEDRLDLVVEGRSAPSGPAVLFGQDASFPDLEQWAQWRYRGTWDGVTLAVEEAPARTGLGRPPGLLQRWRRQRAMERACVQALRRHESRSEPT